MATTTVVRTMIQARRQRVVRGVRRACAEYTDAKGETLGANYV
jgi:hypothetical protein